MLPRRIHQPAGPDPSNPYTNPGPRSCDHQQCTHHVHDHRVLHRTSLVVHHGSHAIRHGNHRGNLPAQTTQHNDPKQRLSVKTSIPCEPHLADFKDTTVPVKPVVHAWSCYNEYCRVRKLDEHHALIAC